jgi:PEP-CTERM motif
MAQDLLKLGMCQLMEQTMTMHDVRKSVLGAAMLSAILVAAPAHAGVTYGFGGTSQGGIGSATMEFDVVGNTLTVKIDNTSPTSLIDNSGANSPGITGFGFNLDPSTLVLGSWSLTAFTSTNVSTTIGTSAVCSGCDWSMGTFLAGVSLDYLPSTGGQIDGALFNPLATSGLPGGQNSVFFTTATLTMTFNEVPSLNDSDVWSPFVRMQAVGNGGSLRLPGDPDCIPSAENDFCGQQQIPEPSALALVSLGLLGVASLTRRRRQF